MYKSSILNYVGLKYMPIVMGSIFLFMSIIMVLNPDSEITVNGDVRKAVFSDTIPFLIIGFVLLIIHLQICQRFVRMHVGQDKFEFQYKRAAIVKKWVEVESIKRYWMVAPPLYSVKFENDDVTYLFNSGYFCVVTPFYVFDLSSMGEFIKERRKDLPLLKKIRNKEI